MDYGVGIVGLGRVAGGHANSIVKAKGVHLAAVCDVDQARLDASTAKLGVPGENSLDKLLARSDVDAILVALPHGLHEQATIAAARAGKHIMVEKPMAMDTGACDRMIAAAKEAGVQLFIAHTERFLSATIKAREIIDSGQIGTPVMATDVWYQPMRLHTRQPWMRDRARGGGFMQMAGSHMIDRLVYLLNSPVKSARGSVKTVYFDDIKCDDMVMAMLEMESGVPAVFTTTSYRDHENGGVDQMYTEIHATDGMVKVDRRRDVYVGRGGKYEQVPVVPDSAVMREWEAFAKSIETGSEPPVPLAHARHVVAVMEAAEESSRTGQTVPIAGR